ncbi:DUF6979 family protein [Caldifermentibacillus hisashii]
MKKRLKERRGTPRSAFLVLCKDGFVKGVSSGDYLTSKSGSKN